MSNLSDISGLGRARVVPLTPPAGSEITFTVPAGRIWLFVALRIQLTTSATVGNRQLAFNWTLASSSTGRVETNVLHPASTVLTHNWGIGSVSTFTVAAGNKPVVGQVYALPDQLYLDGDNSVASLSSQTFNLQAGDQFTIARAIIREWIK